MYFIFIWVPRNNRDRHVGEIYIRNENRNKIDDLQRSHTT